VPDSSPDSGADAREPAGSAAMTTPAHASDGRWARHASTFVRPDLGDPVDT
jgi:hypothetical protein